MNGTLVRLGSITTGLSVAGLLLAGCGPSARAAAGPTPPMVMPSNAVVAANDGGTTVVIDKYMFGPDRLTVAPGTTVTWTNDDDDAHTVVAKDDSFRSGSLARGQSFHYTFNNPGTYSYLCSIHPFMVASVVVAK